MRFCHVMSEKSPISRIDRRKIRIDKSARVIPIQLRHRDISTFSTIREQVTEGSRQRRYGNCKLSDRTWGRITI